MTSLIRDVLFPSAAALALLTAAAIDTATAEEATPAARPAVIAAASVAGMPQQAAAPSSDRASAVAPADETRQRAIERRCERTGRIGKFRITRCD